MMKKKKIHCVLLSLSTLPILCLHRSSGKCDGYCGGDVYGEDDDDDDYGDGWSLSGGDYGEHDYDDDDTTCTAKKVARAMPARQTRIQKSRSTKCYNEI